jgi:ABC-type multidrug transport system ATPase subunit
VLRVDGLGKRYGDRWIFRRLSFVIQRGQVLTILGPNGAGKSTLLSVIAGLAPKSEGSIESPPLAGIGYAALAGELYADLTVAEHLQLTGDLRGCPHRTEELLTGVGLNYAKEFPAGTLSSGMRGRLKLAIATQAEPSLLILDEPSAGLDEEGRAVVRNIVANQVARGAVLLATNDPEERKLATHELELA